MNSLWSLYKQVFLESEEVEIEVEKERKVFSKALL